MKHQVQQHGAVVEQITQKEKLKVALAVAITAKKKQVQRDGVDWKKKAQAARHTLLALSKTLKSSGRASNELHGRLMQLLSEYSDSELLEAEIEQQNRAAVVERSANLTAFINATQVKTHGVHKMLVGEGPY